MAIPRGLPRVLQFGLQPAILIAILLIWYANRESPLVYPLAVVGVQLLLGILEQWFPARPEWRQSVRERLINISIVFVVGTGTLFVADLYAQTLSEPLAGIRESLNLSIWPHSWPLLAQVFLVFFLSEFIWYWVHRAEHRWPAVWRLSGHGAHHSFKHLGAINFGANHPLEMFLLVLPAALVEFFFGVGIAAAGAAVLTVVQASIAHTNLTLNTRWIGLLFTTNHHHIHHHSIVFEESNTNYGCSAIVWDRLFGTFAAAPTAETGTGPTEPTLWEKFLMPLREPGDTSISPLEPHNS